MGIAKYIYVANFTNKVYDNCATSYPSELFWRKSKTWGRGERSFCGRQCSTTRRPPGPLRRLGRRRGWLAAIQPALAAAAALLALSDPAHLPFAALGIAALVAFLSASQDIAIDAWRIEVFPRIARVRRWRPMSGAIASRC